MLIRVILTGLQGKEAGNEDEVRLAEGARAADLLKKRRGGKGRKGWQTGKLDQRTLNFCY